MSTTATKLEDELRLPTGAIARAAGLRESEQLQKEHYDRIASEYEAHYSDACSREYRDRFIYEPMFQGINLSGRKVLDAMCGSGQTTGYLLARNAVVAGLDISRGTIGSFQTRWPHCQAVHRSLLDSGLPSNSFDCVAVVGGLHHMHPNVNEAVREIHRVLKPGGHFCFMEPHSGSIPDRIRRFWYKRDRFFSANEAAINVDELEEEFSTHFAFTSVKYLGNIAFLLVLNSMIFRIPLQAKPLYSRTLIKVEAAIRKLQGKASSCFVVAQWQKKP